MNGTTVNEIEKVERLNKIKNIITNRYVNLGLVIAITAVVTGLITRSGMEKKTFSYDELETIVNDVELTELVKS